MSLLWYQIGKQREKNKIINYPLKLNLFSLIIKGWAKNTNQETEQEDELTESQKKLRYLLTQIKAKESEKSAVIKEELGEPALQSISLIRDERIAMLNRMIKELKKDQKYTKINLDKLVGHEAKVSEIYGKIISENGLLDKLKKIRPSFESKSAAERVERIMKASLFYRLLITMFLSTDSDQDAFKNAEEFYNFITADLSFKRKIGYANDDIGKTVNFILNLKELKGISEPKLNKIKRLITRMLEE